METVLELQQVKKTIKGRTIIHDLSFSVRAGEVFGFLGYERSGENHYDQNDGRINETVSGRHRNLRGIHYEKLCKSGQARRSHRGKPGAVQIPERL